MDFSSFGNEAMNSILMLRKVLLSTILGDAWKEMKA